MEDNDNKINRGEIKAQESLSKPPKEEDALTKAINILSNMQKNEVTAFLNTFDPILKEYDRMVKESRKESMDLKLNMFRHKVSLIAFNGLLLTLMVSSKGKIPFGLLTFTLLFASIVVGLIQIMVYYFKSEYENIEMEAFIRRVKAIFQLCKSQSSDEDTIHDAKIFLQNKVLEHKTKYNNVPELLRDMDKKFNHKKIIMKAVLVELLFFAPFVFGLGLAVYQLYLYIL